MNICKTILVTIATGGWLLFGGVAIAHDGPEHDIEELTDRMKAEGESADLLLQRAIEYSVLGKGAEAAKDLERALHFEAHSPKILRELSRAYFTTGKTNEALDTATRGIKYAEEGQELASILMVRCEILRARKDYQKALDDANKAIGEHPDNAEWYLARGALQQQLGLKKERIKGLADGVHETGSGLLEAEWIDALIDGGKAEQALEKIEAELKDARLQSSWLLRRAKVRLAMKQKDDAKVDLDAALAELNQRLARGTHDPLLLADRGQVYELLGQKEEAKKDYESARDKGVRDEWLRERIRALTDKKDEKKKDGKKKDDAKPVEEKKDEPKEDKADGDDQK
jgi:tetratricopeptide (TPR) repeat protein